MKFIDKLLNATRRNKSLLCIGLDTDPALIPEKISVFEFNREIIEATKDLVCAYKPNLGFYEAQGIEGLQALKRTVDYIPDNIPVIADAKRGDIGNTAKGYARAIFELYRFDAVTVNPYLGLDAIEHLPPIPTGEFSYSAGHLIPEQWISSPWSAKTMMKNVPCSRLLP
jgi:orotidine-5'-phosphate decarboxylase